MFDELLAHPEVSETAILRSPIGVMALHGGIEKKTGTIASKIADRAGASLYVVHQSERLRWHVPSIHYDPGMSRHLARFLEHVDIAVSLHGFGRRHLERSVLVGGASSELAAEMSDRLRTATKLNVVSGEEIPAGLKGRHPANPVNMPRGGGVQLELSHSCRHSPHVEPLIDAVTDFVVSRAGRPVQSSPSNAFNLPT